MSKFSSHDLRDFNINSREVRLECRHSEEVPNMVRLQYCLVSLCFALTLAGVAPAQPKISTGVSRETILDKSGAVTVDADVTAKNLDTQTETAQKTDGDGRFVFLSLRPGRYSVTASKSGFSKVIQ